MIANFGKTGRYSTLAFLTILGLIFAFSQSSAVSLHSGFPVSSDYLDDTGEIKQSVLNYDYDKDGLVEIIFGSDVGYVFFVNSTGIVENSFGPLPGPCSTPSIADINADGELEMVFGSQALLDTVNQIYKAAVYAIQADMSLVHGFPCVIIGLDDLGGIDYPPSLYDVDGDGYQEIFAGTVG